MSDDKKKKNKKNGKLEPNDDIAIGGIIIGFGAALIAASVFLGQDHKYTKLIKKPVKALTNLPEVFRDLIG